MKKTGILLIIIAFMAFPGWQPEARAMDPVTIAILTPIAIKGAQIAAPYVIRGLQSGAAHMMTMGEDLLDIFRLPVGVLQMTLGLPFRQFSGGVRNMVYGTMAPFKLTLKILVLPIAFCNFGVG